jgi:hypothetical protein
MAKGKPAPRGTRVHRHAGELRCSCRGTLCGGGGAQPWRPGVRGPGEWPCAAGGCEGKAGDVAQPVVWPLRPADRGGALGTRRRRVRGECAPASGAVGDAVRTAVPGGRQHLCAASQLCAHHTASAQRNRRHSPHAFALTPSGEAFPHTNPALLRPQLPATAKKTRAQAGAQ